MRQYIDAESSSDDNDDDDNNTTEALEYLHFTRAEITEQIRHAEWAVVKGALILK